MRKIGSILRAVAVRALVYSSIGMIVVFSLMGWPSLPQYYSHRTPADDAGAHAGAGWPQLRGANYDAHAADTDLTDSWPAEGPLVLWSKKIGQGFSALIVKGNRVYTQTQALLSQRLMAMDADTGETIWQYAYGKPFEAGGMFPGPRSTPTWADGRIYYAWPDSVVGCVNAEDGKPIWSVNLSKQFGGQIAPFGYCCSPVVEDGKVIVPLGGRSASVVALDALTGALVWRSGDANGSYCSALPITFHGHRQVVAFLQNTLAGFDLQSGRLLWQQAYSQDYDEHSASPLYQEPYLRTTQAFRAGSDLYLLEEAPAASGEFNCTPRHVQHDEKMSNDVASSVLHNGFLYGFDLEGVQSIRGSPSPGLFRCMDFKTGQIRWSSKEPGQATIAVADGKLFLFNDTGRLLLVRANPDRYEELARFQVFLGETCWTAPTLDHGRLYLRSPTQTACLFVGKPKHMTARQREAAASGRAISKVERPNLNWLLGGEREYPFEMSDLRELTLWYSYALGIFGLAGLLAVITSAALRLFGWGRGSDVPRIVFWAALAVLGIVVTAVANRFSPRFVFTWPLSLIVFHQLALSVIWIEPQAKPSWRRSWAPLVGTGFFVSVCLLYFKIIRQLNLVPAWYFLIPFPISWPIALPAARRLAKRGGLGGDLVWTLAVYTIYFWTAGIIMMVRGAGCG